MTLEIYYLMNSNTDSNSVSVDVNPVLLHSYEVKDYSITSLPLNSNESSIVITADNKIIFEGFYITNTNHEILETYKDQYIILSVKTIDNNGNEKFHINAWSNLSWQLGFSMYPNIMSDKLLSNGIENVHKLALEMYENEDNHKGITDEDIEELKRLLDNDEFDIDKL